MYVPLLKPDMRIIEDGLKSDEIRALLETDFAGVLAISRDVQAATEGLALDAHISYYALTPSSFPRRRESNSRTFRIPGDRVKAD
jgi:hypothetical protein